MLPLSGPGLGFRKPDCLQLVLTRMVVDDLKRNVLRRKILRKKSFCRKKRKTRDCLEHVSIRKYKEENARLKRYEKYYQEFSNLILKVSETLENEKSLCSGESK
jgi:hypothetical protein